MSIVSTSDIEDNLSFVLFSIAACFIISWILLGLNPCSLGLEFPSGPS